MVEIEGKSFLCGYENSTILMMCEIKGGSEPFVTTFNLSREVVQHVAVSTRIISYSLILEPMHHLAEIDCSATNGAGKSSTRSSIFVFCKYNVSIFIFSQISLSMTYFLLKESKRNISQKKYNFVLNTF